MKKTRSLLILGVIAAIAFGIFLADLGTANAQDCRIVRIHGGMGVRTSLEIEPRNIWINPGTCVVWANLSRIRNYHYNLYIYICRLNHYIACIGY